MIDTKINCSKIMDVSVNALFVNNKKIIRASRYIQINRKTTL